ncbi:MAG TPA: Gfo/Idh/MocA family oxidoreductase [Devosiaceae bacterium]
MADPVNALPIRVGVVGLGYFSQFHLRAWQRIEGVSLVGVADADPVRVDAARQEYDTDGFDDATRLLASADPDILDIVTPPSTHATIIRAALRPGRVIICQKPFCSDLTEAEAVANEARIAGATLLIHENFRFQPWYRKLKSLLESGEYGQVYACRFALRPGDGRGPDAYLGRQPSFQKMKRFLVHETGVHFLDLFTWLFGPIETVYADLRQLNPAIAGEDDGVLILSHEGGVRSVFDGNRLSDHIAGNRRKTMGEMQIETERGTLRLDGEGRLFQREFGANEETEIVFSYEDRDFGGGCVEALNRHVIEHLREGRPLENRAGDYLAIVRLDEATYRSADRGCRVSVRGEGQGDGE